MPKLSMKLGQPALFQESACHERNPNSLRSVHYPMVQTAVTYGEGAGSLESVSVPQLYFRSYLCFLNSYKRKTVPFFTSAQVLPSSAPKIPGRRSTLSKMFLPWLLTSLNTGSSARTVQC